MLKQKFMFKVLVIVVLLAAGSHVAGFESAFCNESDPMQSDSHGCQVCQIGHHSAVALESVSTIPVMAPIQYSVTHETLFKLQEPIHSLLRPPISY